MRRVIAGAMFLLRRVIAGANLSYCESEAPDTESPHPHREEINALADVIDFEEFPSQSRKNLDKN
ncbi:hypothetical protein [Bacillus ndiopicus]|uniref:hypothetical protein n=1 Tax=Bacillus ndiopicus TaxID=1347368 RepID=UPI0005A6AFC2|nr:hypothetical protein [Bacillus ndiopicus]